MTEKHRRKLVRDAAEEVCWGLAICAQLGMTSTEVAKMLEEDFREWASLVDWKALK